MISKMGVKSLEKFSLSVSLSVADEEDKKVITDFIIKREKELACYVSPIAQNAEIKSLELE